MPLGFARSAAPVKVGSAADGARALTSSPPSPTYPAREIGFRSLTEGIGTTTPAGRLIFHVFGALAEFEHALIRERTAAGLEAARARGHHGGRPRAMTPDKLAVARRLYDEGELPLAAIAATIEVSRSTLYRRLAVVSA